MRQQPNRYWPLESWTCFLQSPRCRTVSEMGIYYIKAGQGRTLQQLSARSYCFIALATSVLPPLIPTHPSKPSSDFIPWNAFEPLRNHWCPVIPCTYLWVSLHLCGRVICCGLLEGGDCASQCVFCIQCLVSSRCFGLNCVPQKMYWVLILVLWIMTLLGNRVSGCDQVKMRSLG